MIMTVKSKKMIVLISMILVVLAISVCIIIVINKNNSMNFDDADYNYQSYADGNLDGDSDVLSNKVILTYGDGVYEGTEFHNGYAVVHVASSNMYNTINSKGEYVGEILVANEDNYNNMKMRNGITLLTNEDENLFSAFSLNGDTIFNQFSEPGIEYAELSDKGNILLLKPIDTVNGRKLQYKIFSNSGEVKKDWTDLGETESTGVEAQYLGGEVFRIVLLTAENADTILINIDTEKTAKYYAGYNEDYGPYHDGSGGAGLVTSSSTFKYDYFNDSSSGKTYSITNSYDKFNNGKRIITGLFIDKSGIGRKYLRKFFIQDSDTLGLKAITGDFEGKKCPADPSSIGDNGLFLVDSRDGTFHPVETKYYDSKFNAVIDLTGKYYKILDTHPFVNGVATFVVNNNAGKTFALSINEKGEELYEPIQIDTSSFQCLDKYIVWDKDNVIRIADAYTGSILSESQVPQYLLNYSFSFSVDGEILSCVSSRYIIYLDINTGELLFTN